MTPQKTFVSYAREDAGFALKLAGHVRSAGGDIWLDKLDIRAGVPWDRAIEDALQNCGRFLIILSPESVGSTNVMDEVSYAIEHNKQVIPVLYKDCRVPLRLRRLHYIDCTANQEDGLRNLVTELGTLLKPPLDVPVVPVQVRSWYQKALLMYAPSGLLAGMLHAFFYLGLFVLAIAPLSIASEEGLTEAAKVGLVWLLILVGAHWLARVLDVPAGIPGSRTPRQRVLLLYWPLGTTARILHVLFYTLMGILGLGLIGVAMEWKTDPESGDALIGLAVCAVFIALIRSVARRLDHATPANVASDKPEARAAGS
ncbi:MAG: toll/interleukin-1 receptor domain-containing protein [Bryobacteraceae bacterium]